MHTRVDGSAYGSPERIPRLVIEPSEELLGPIVIQVLCRAVVKPWVELMDDPAVVLDGVHTDPASLIGSIQEDCQDDEDLISQNTANTVLFAAIGRNIRSSSSGSSRSRSSGSGRRR